MSLVIDPSTGVDIASDAVERAIAAGAHEAQVVHTTTEKFEVNYDATDVTLVRTGVVDGLSISVYIDTCVGTSSLTGRAPDQVQAAVESAVAAATAGAPDDANRVAPGPGDAAVDRGDVEPDKEAMVDAVVRQVDWMGREHPKLLVGTAYSSFDNTWTSYANSAGRTQHARVGTYSGVLMCSGKDAGVATSFDFAGVVSGTPLGELTELSVFRHLMDELEASFGARPVPETFVGDVIFTPGALEGVLGSIGQALSGMALVRKATPFADKVGQRIASERFTLLHRPSELWASPFDGSGFANRDLDVIVDGVLESFHIGWYTSNKLGLPMTCGQQDYVVAPGDTALADIVANTKRGIVLGRFSGGAPNPALDFSGVAKNSFYVEDGEIKHPLSETMIAGNLCAVLEAVWAVSSELVDFGSSRLPWVASSGVTISTAG